MNIPKKNTFAHRMSTPTKQNTVYYFHLKWESHD